MLAFEDVAAMVCAIGFLIGVATIVICGVTLTIGYTIRQIKDWRKEDGK